MKPGFFGNYDPSSDLSKKTNRARFKEDKIILMELLPEFLVLCRQTPRTPAEDEFTRGLRIMFQTHEVPLWLAFAATIFLDIHRILRDQAESCFTNLTNVINVARATIEDNLDFHTSLRIDNWPKENDEAMLAFSNELKHWIVDDPHRVEAKRIGRQNIPKPFYLFRHHPWLCGLWKYYCQIQLQSIGVAFVNAWGSLQHCAHLYNAIRREKLMDKSWSDMELLFAIQGHDVFFSGSPPTDTEGYLRRNIMALGGSAANFSQGNASRKKNDKLIVSKRGPNTLKELAPVLDTFKHRFCSEHPRFELRTEDVERILEKSEWETEMDENGLPSQLTKDPDIKTKKGNLKKLHAAKLLTLLRAVSHAEILKFSFEYLTMHRVCFVWSKIHVETS
jgi:hypothetical protein